VLNALNYTLFMVSHVNFFIISIKDFYLFKIDKSVFNFYLKLYNFK